MQRCVKNRWNLQQEKNSGNIQTRERPETRLPGVGLPTMFEHEHMLLYRITVGKIAAKGS